MIIGPSDQCQNQKNTVDPEIMIKQYGADSVRWFILSDSPPERRSMVRQRRNIIE